MDRTVDPNDMESDDEEGSFGDDPRYWGVWVDDQEDRPLWEQEADLETCRRCRRLAEEVDDDGWCGECVRLRDWQPPPGKRLCSHCGLDPMAYTSDESCRNCHRWLLRNRGKYSPARLREELQVQIERRMALRNRRSK